MVYRLSDVGPALLGEFPYAMSSSGAVPTALETTLQSFEA